MKGTILDKTFNLELTLPHNSWTYFSKVNFELIVAPSNFWSFQYVQYLYLHALACQYLIKHEICLH